MDYFEESEHLARFEREARTAAQIQNRYVMAIHDIGAAEDPSTGREIKYIVIEHVKGKSLSEHLKTAEPDQAGIVRLAEKIATGLVAAHKLNIVHRDIKASNIIVDEENQPKILDFGLAKPVALTAIGDADIEITEIRDARERHARLTSWQPTGPRFNDPSSAMGEVT